MIYRTLMYFVRTYFHQDWMSDYSSSLSAIDDFVQHESPEKVSMLHSELLELLESGDISETTIHDYGGNYSPLLDGLSTQAWLEEICRKTESFRKSQ